MTFETRQVGQTSLRVSTLGIGIATIGATADTMAFTEGRAVIDAALDAGITYFDTAPFYGLGKAERITGDQIRPSRSSVTLSTKCGRLLKADTGDYEPPAGWVDPLPFAPVFEYTYDAIMRSHEDSLQRLGLAAVDILYVHDIGVMTHGEERNKDLWDQLANQGGYKALRELRDSGAIKAIGLGVNEWPVLMAAFDIGDWDVHLLANRYNLLEQEPLSPLFETCARRGTSIVAAGPFAAGILAGTNVWGPPNGAYQAAPEEILDRVEKLQAVCQAHNVPLGAAALQFALAHPVVCSVLTGPKSTSELEGILKWWQTDIPAGFWSDLASGGLLAAGTPLPGGKGGA